MTAYDSLWQLMTASDNLWQLMTAYDSLWEVMTAYDSLWQLMTTYDSLWQLLTTFDNFWQLWTTFDCLWQLVTAYDSLWQLLTTFDNFWQLLTTFSTFDSFWQLLKTFDNFWQLLTTFDNFWQLLITLTTYTCTLCKLSSSQDLVVGLVSEGKIHFEQFWKLSFFPSQGHNSVNIGLKLTSRTIFRNYVENKSFHLGPRLIWFFALLCEIQALKVFTQVILSLLYYHIFTCEGAAQHLHLSFCLSHASSLGRKIPGCFSLFILSPNDP